ncbi:MAG: hypothetical protein QOE86_3724 [Solirubrobacteraceae bacterium]|nr:hypothetical protein [Solirubrobacteraceae bacterium]
MQGMNRKLLTALVSAGVLSVGTGVMATPASATPRTFVVTLLGGAQVTLTVDVPAGTPADQISFPGLSAPVVSVQEITPAPTSTPGVGVQLTPTPAPTSSATPAPTNGPDSSSGSSGTPSGKAGGSSSQQTATHKPTIGGTLDSSGNLVSTVGAAKGKAKSVIGKGRNVDGTPTIANPGFTLAQPGAAPIGVPNFFIDKFRIPPFLLPIYQAAGIQYGIRWEVLAAINEIETDYGRNLNVSSAGAVGWMQFLPSTFKQYAVDANRDGIKDPYNPVDAIFTAARYLRAAGADTDVRKAVFAYNHADWYVDSVLLRARVLGGLPANFVGSLTGLTQGHFPVAAKATYADDLSDAQLAKRRRLKNPAWLVQSNGNRRGINVYSRDNAPAIAVQDGRILRVGRSARLGKFVQMQDVYGNTYTYGQLKHVSKLYPAPKAQNVSKQQISRELSLPAADAAPSTPATAGGDATSKLPSPATAALKAPITPASAGTQAAQPTRTAAAKPTAAPAGKSKERLFANPFRPNATRNGGGDQIIAGKAPRGSFEVFRAGATRVFGVHTKSNDITLKPLRAGARVMAGTVLGRLGATQAGTAPHLLFEIRPAGRGAPRIDPKPILDGWKLLESTAIYRAAGKNPFFGSGAATPTIGQILLMSKEALQRQVLADPRADIYECGRRDIELGLIDRRVLATIEFLSLSGLKPTITALECGHSLMTASGNVSEHSTGDAVDIAKINGIPILGHQGPGSITDITIQRLLTLQGLMKPHQIISLMTFKNADNTLSLPDHADHIHIGFHPMYGTNSKMAKQVNATLKPKQWIKLIDRLGKIDNPTVRLQPSKYAIQNAPKRGSQAHAGD